MFQVAMLVAALVGDPVTPEYFCDNVEVRVLWYPNRVALNIAYRGEYYEHGVRAFAEIYRHNCTCTIHALEPRTNMGPRSEAVGHEFLHCIWGFYHK